MRPYILLLIMIILITSCAQKAEVEKAKPEKETPMQEPEEIIKEEAQEPEMEETGQEEGIIEIKKDSFYPAEKTIEKNTEIKWIKKDTRDYKIACYLDGARVIQSPDLKEGDSFAYTFLKEGEYTCITVPYGMRNIIKVEAEMQLLSPAASAISSRNKSIKGGPLAAAAMASIIVILFFIYGRKRQG